MWPLIVIEHLGGADPVDRPIKSDPIGPIAWIGLWIYYYLLVTFWHGWSRKR
jgi:hypothetical protein